MNRPIELPEKSKITFSQVLLELLKTLYQVLIFTTTVFIVGGKTLFEFLHEKFVETQYRKKVTNERYIR